MLSFYHYQSFILFLKSKIKSELIKQLVLIKTRTDIFFSPVWIVTSTETYLKFERKRKKKRKNIVWFNLK